MDTPSDRPTPPVPVRLAPDGAALVILDQTALPEAEVERTLTTVEQIEEAISSLRVRGAPLIGITAALGVAALARRRVAAGDPASGSAGAEPLGDAVRAWCRRLVKARPTAVNLAWALARMEDVVEQTGHADPVALAGRLEEEARAIHAEDREMCRRIGEHALGLLGGGGKALTLVTHCNAGALATGGIGTALAPVYLAHGAGRPVRVLADETRPLLQGSRLTAWELHRAGVDVTVLADGTAAAAMAASRPDAVLVGADRIAANGDVANKVGTYGLAVVARHHGVPFHVLAPTSTVDLATPDGAHIPIEHRDPDEVRRGFGRLTAPEKAGVWSPAFDVTPAALITTIVTEQGVHRTPFRESLRAAVEAAGRERRRGEPGDMRGGAGAGNPGEGRGEVASGSGEARGGASGGPGEAGS